MQKELKNVQQSKSTQDQQTQIDNLSSEITRLEKQLAQSQKSEQELSKTNEEKAQQLTKVNKSVEFWKGEYQKALKKSKEEPEPSKSNSPETKPISP